MKTRVTRFGAFVGLELARTGEWDAMSGRAKITLDELQAIAENFTRYSVPNAPDEDALVKVPVKLGHKKADNLLDHGMPAAGWVRSLSVRVDDEKAGRGTLIGTIETVSETIDELIMSGAYDSLSVEVFNTISIGDEEVGPVLTGLALLGADPPAVKGLKGLAETYLPDKAKERLGIAASAEPMRFSQAPADVHARSLTKKPAIERFGAVSGMVNGRLWDMVSEDVSRDDVIGALLEAVPSLTVTDLNTMLDDGSLPSEDVMRGLADELGLDFKRVQAAAVLDGRAFTNPDLEAGMTSAAIKKSLGLPEDADEAAVEAAIEKLKEAQAREPEDSDDAEGDTEGDESHQEEPAGAEDAAVEMAALKAKVAELEAKDKSRDEADTKTAVESIVASAVGTKLLPSGKGAYIELGQDIGPEKLRKALDALPDLNITQTFGHAGGSRLSSPNAGDADVKLSADDLAVARQMGWAEEDLLNGERISRGLAPIDKES